MCLGMTWILKILRLISYLWPMWLWWWGRSQNMLTRKKELNLHYIIETKRKSTVALGYLWGLVTFQRLSKSNTMYSCWGFCCLSLVVFLEVALTWGLNFFFVTLTLMPQFTLINASYFTSMVSSVQRLVSWIHFLP